MEAMDHSMYNMETPQDQNAYTSAPVEHAFNPYTDNGGTIVAIAGEDFAVIAGDTRMSEGYSILTRYAPKVFKLNDKVVMAANGFAADAKTLVKRVQQRLELYRHNHDKDANIGAIARLNQQMLYGKRFFPYYAYVILGGLDEHGKGAVYSYDPVGSYERETCRAGGAAASIIQPFLDNQVNFKNQANVTPHLLPLDDVLRIIKDSFTSATERHIEVGDGLQIYIVRQDGVTLEEYPLKRD